MKIRLEDLPDQSGKITIVTGANIGLGYYTALGLAKKGAKVIMACRNLTKAEEAKKSMLQEQAGLDLEIMELDLNSLESVRSFAKSFSDKYERLDILVENAGIMMPPLGRTKEGFESQMGVNYFAHFLLAKLLFPLLQKSDAGRLVTLSSLAHKSGRLDFENLNAEKSYSKWGAYGMSKLACLMFAIELQRRLDGSGSKVIAVSAHPGGSNTNLAQHFPTFLKLLMAPLMMPFTHKPRAAAMPTLLAAIGPDVKGGQYYGPTGFNEMKGSPGLAKIEPHALDAESSARLWLESEKLIGEKFAV